MKARVLVRAGLVVMAACLLGGCVYHDHYVSRGGGGWHGGGHSHRGGGWHGGHHR